MGNGLACTFRFGLPFFYVSRDVTASTRVTVVVCSERPVSTSLILPHHSAKQSKALFSLALNEKLLYILYLLYII